jgi:hypothetical protein
VEEGNKNGLLKKQKQKKEFCSNSSPSHTRSTVTVNPYPGD